MSARKTILCPMLMQGFYAGPLSGLLAEVGAGTTPPEMIDASIDGSCVCIGSRCAWWCSSDTDEGYCGSIRDEDGDGQTWPDPNHVVPEPPPNV